MLSSDSSVEGGGKPFVVIAACLGGAALLVAICYLVFLTPSGGGVPRESEVGGVTAPGASRARITTAQTRSEVVLDNEPARRYQVRFVDSEAGIPVVGVRVFVIPASQERGGRSSIVRKENAAAMSDKSGEVLLLLEATSFEYLREGYQSSIALDLDPAKDHTIYMAVGAAVEVAAKDVDGNPLEGVVVRVSRAPVDRSPWGPTSAEELPARTLGGEDAIYIARTDSTGNASIDGVPPGKIRTAVFHPTYVLASLEHDNRAPGRIRAVFVRPWVAIANVQESAVLQSHLRIPPGFGRADLTQHSMTSLRASLMESHHPDFCLVCAPNRKQEASSTNIVCSLYTERGWQDYKVKLQPYDPLIKPETLSIDGALTSGQLMFPVKFQIIGPSGLSVDFAFETPFVLSHRAWKMMQSVPIVNSAQTPLEFGQEYIVDSRNKVALACLKSNKIVVDEGARDSGQIAIHCDRWFAPSTIRCVGERGVEDSEVDITIRDSKGRVHRTFMTNSGMENTFWLVGPQSHVSVEFRRTGRVVEQIIPVQSCERIEITVRDS